MLYLYTMYVCTFGTASLETYYSRSSEQNICNGKNKDKEILQRGIFLNCVESYSIFDKLLSENVD